MGSAETAHRKDTRQEVALETPAAQCVKLKDTGQIRWRAQNTYSVRKIHKEEAHRKKLSRQVSQAEHQQGKQGVQRR